MQKGAISGNFASSLLRRTVLCYQCDLEQFVISIKKTHRDRCQECKAAFVRVNLSDQLV